MGPGDIPFSNQVYCVNTKHIILLCRNGHGPLFTIRSSTLDGFDYFLQDFDEDSGGVVVNFLSGVTTQEVLVTIISDGINEGTEEFEVFLEVTGGSEELDEISIGTAVVVILDGKLLTMWVTVSLEHELYMELHQVKPGFRPVWGGGGGGGGGREGDGIIPPNTPAMLHVTS